MLVIKYSYSIKALAKNRKLYSLKICYKKHLEFLKYQQNTAEAIANRIVSNTNYRYCRQQVTSFYIQFLRDNFVLKNTAAAHTFKSKNITYFLSNFKQYIALKDLNRTFLWRALQYNSLFTVKITRKKKKKKIFLNTEVYFMRQSHRLLLIWVWLKAFIKAHGSSKRTLALQLQLSLENFFGTTGKNNAVESIKLQIYKIKLLRSL